MRHGPLATVLLSLSFACSLEPDAPVLTIVGSDDAVGIVYLQWLPPTRGDFSGFLLEIRYAGGDFQPLVTTGVSFAWAADVSGAPQGSDVSFRVRALPDRGGRRVSNVVVKHRGLLPPGFACSALCTPEGGTFSLVMATTSVSLVLERRSVDCNGGATVWAVLPLAPGAMTYDDADLAQWTDGSSLEYRLTAVSGADRSAPATLTTTPAPPLPPASLAATSVASGTLISFQNASRCAVVVAVRSHPDNQVVGLVPATPGPGTLAELLLPSAPPTACAYSAAAQLDGPGAKAWSPLSTWAPSPQARAASPGWNVSLADVTPGTLVARLPSGAMATATVVGLPTAAFAPGLAGPDELSFPWGSYARALLADAPGHAQALIVEPTPIAGTNSLVHAEHGGGAWTEENLATGSELSSSALDVAPDGSLLAAWRSGWDLYVSWRGSAGWQVLEPILDFFRSADAFRLAGDDTGGPHVLAHAFSGALVHWSRGVAGWQSETLPVTATDLFGLLAAPAGLSVVYSPDGVSVAQIETNPGGWGLPVGLAGLAASWRVRTARSPDGSRIAVATPDGALWLRDAAGASVRTWHRCGGEYAVGFGWDGKAWVMDGLADIAPSGIPDPAALFEEP
jgi:hypothetical protein